MAEPERGLVRSIGSCGWCLIPDEEATINKWSRLINYQIHGLVGWLVGWAAC